MAELRKICKGVWKKEGGMRSGLDWIGLELLKNTKRMWRRKPARLDTVPYEYERKE